MGRYAPDDGLAELATLPTGEALSFLPLDRDEAGAFLEPLRAPRVWDVEALSLAQRPGRRRGAGLTSCPVSTAAVEAAGEGMAVRSVEGRQMERSCAAGLGFYAEDCVSRFTRVTFRNALRRPRVMYGTGGTLNALRKSPAGSMA